nr:hypothetical protein TetV2_00409 [Oceanusvirus sp.]
MLKHGAWRRFPIAIAGRNPPPSWPAVLGVMAMVVYASTRERNDDNL